jgi:uncharacterized membrane protein (UPF0127 family)
MRYFALMAGLALLCSCGNGDKTATVDDLNTRDVKLPGGQILQVETVMDTIGMLRGLAFRDKMAEDRGMLFVHRAPGKYTYWMFQTLIPLDIIWLDESRQVVEIVADAPPCKSEASKCPHYGGNQESKYVLEIGGGLAKKYGLRVGDAVLF